MATILIAGGSGFIGTHLSTYLSSQHEVRILSRTKSKSPSVFYWNPHALEYDAQAFKSIDKMQNKTPIY